MKKTVSMVRKHMTVSMCVSVGSKCVGYAEAQSRFLSILPKSPKESWSSCLLKLGDFKIVLFCIRTKSNASEVFHDKGIKELKKKKKGKNLPSHRSKWPGGWGIRVGSKRPRSKFLLCHLPTLHLGVVITKLFVIMGSVSLSFDQKFHPGPGELFPMKVLLNWYTAVKGFSFDNLVVSKKKKTDLLKNTQDPNFCTQTYVLLLSSLQSHWSQSESFPQDQCILDLISTTVQ